MKINHRPLDFNEIDYENQVSTDLTSNRELSALLLVHGFIEAFLREWLFYSGSANKQDHSPGLIKQIERIQFRQLLLVHSALGNIKEKEFSELMHFNKMRNKVAHNLVKINYKDETFRKEVSELVTVGLSLCKNIDLKFKECLDRRAEEFPGEN
jgi:hypothetical protein